MPISERTDHNLDRNFLSLLQWHSVLHLALAMFLLKVI
jgi:hypothetical protein